MADSPIDLTAARRERAARRDDDWRPIHTTRGELRRIVNEVAGPFIARAVAEAVAAERRRFIRLAEPQGTTNQ